jgi:phosphatidylglycerophosphate synthase
MPRVHLAPLSSIAAGLLGLFAVDRVSPLSAAGWAAGLLYLLVSNGLLARGLQHSGMARVGWGNAATATRSTLVGVVTALVTTSFSAQVAVPVFIALASIALALDAVDGWLARRTQTVSALGARFDMEVDAFLLLVLSAYVATILGWWVLTIGLLRYLFVVVGWLVPWMRRTLPPRYWRKVVTASAGIALILAATAVPPTWACAALALIALGLLLESFGRDVIWLIAHRSEGAMPAAVGREKKEVPS